MSVPPSSPIPPDAAPQPEISSDEQVRIFWQKNGTLITGFFAIVLLAIVAKGGWDYLGAQRERGIANEFAAAEGVPAKLRAFAQAHPDNPLAGVAQLRLADDAYAAGRLPEALDGYQKASAVLTAGPLAARLQLGLGVTQIQTGHAAAGEAALRQLAGDTRQPGAIRAEAAYQLASAAAAAGRAADVQKLAAQILQIDPSSPWAQRAFALEASLPPAPAAGPR